MGDEKISPGDAEELAARFTAHGRELFGYACFLARGDRALAEDLVQAAFEAAGRAWCTLRCLADMGISRGAVKSHTARAMASLRKVLELEK